MVSLLSLLLGISKSENPLWLLNGEELIAMTKTVPKQHEKQQEKGKRTKQELD